MKNTIFKDILQTIIPFSTIYLLWFTFCYLFLQISPIFPDNDFLFKTISTLSLLFFIFLASCSTAIFILYIEKYLKTNTYLRLFLILFTLVIGISLFIFTRLSNNINDFIFIISTANLIVFANLIGTWISYPLKRTTELIPVCIVMSLADLLSVIGGPTKQIVENVEKYYKSGMEGLVPAGDFLLLKIPIPGLNKLIPIFGVADWIIISFLSGAVLKFKINDNIMGKSLKTMQTDRISAYLPISAIGLTSAILMAQFLNLALPALPIINLFFITHILIKAPASRTLNKSEWKLIFLFSTMMIGIAVIRYYGFF